MSAYSIPARSRAAEKSASLSSLDFLRWARHELSRKPILKVRLQGTSMLPAIRDGEVVLVERMDGTPIREGEIVLYCSSSETAVVHRVVGFSENSYGPLVIARGDGCSLDDVPVPVERLLGRAIGIERDDQLVPLVTRRRSWRTRLADSVRSLLA